MAGAPWVQRSGRHEDADAVVELWRVAEAEPSVTDDPHSVRQLIAHDPDALIIAEMDGHVIATIVAGFDGWRGNLYRLAVHPEFRRRGIALALVAEAERRLAGRGARRVNALVVAAHPAAVRFWDAAGYSLDGRIGRHVKTLPG